MTLSMFASAFVEVVLLSFLSQRHAIGRDSYCTLSTHFTIAEQILKEQGPQFISVTLSSKYETGIQTLKWIRPG